MTNMQVYVQGKSKAEINRRLEDGKVLVAVEHKLGNETKWPLNTLPDGTLVKVWEKEVNGSPYAKAYGRWNAKSGRLK
jgi:hypothetical protein